MNEIIKKDEIKVENLIYEIRGKQVMQIVTLRCYLDMKQNI